MAGVASPMLRRNRSSFTRFFVGLAIGHVAAAALIALLLSLVGSLLAGVVPLTGRLVVASTVAIGFGVADLLNRTPHVWRQVPQRFIDILQPGTLGTIWGFDLGLLVTTQKTTSLLWTALPAIALLEPSHTLAAFVGFSLVWIAATFVGSLKPWATQVSSKLGRRWQRPLRIVTGVLLIAAAVESLATATLFR